MTKVAIVNINVEYVFSDETTDDEIETFVQNVELPENYVEDSFDLVKIIKEN